MQMKELSLLTFQKKFDTVKKCEAYLFKQRFPKGFICPKCGHTESYYITTVKRYECSECHHQTSITAGTIMHGTRTSLKKWFWAIYLSSTDKGGISALNLKKKIGVSYPTAWLMLHKIREAMKSQDAKYQLAGLIEIDEAYFGGKDEDNKRGRGTKKAKVLVQVSTDEEGKPQFAKLSIIDNVKSNTVLTKIQENVIEESTIKTDGYRSYNGLSSKGFKHETTQSLMKWVHIVISNAKTFIKGTYHGACNSDHLQMYLDEFSYRFNRRFWEGQLFNRLLGACIGCETVTYRDLTR